jgi:hypothetical protein
MNESRRVLVVGLATVLVACGGAVAMQERPAERAFQHYERIRVALAQDTAKDIAADAKALTPLARELAGDTAAAAAESLAAADTIEKAREHFSVLSDALVPKFLEAGIEGVQGFMCPMAKKQWAQRGNTPANPYYGKAMATCGTPIKKGAK